MSGALRMVSIGEALAQAHGATGIDKAVGGIGLHTDIAIVAAHKRAANLQIPMDYAKKKIEEARQLLKRAVKQCDSPIERRLLPYLVFGDYGTAFASFPAQLHCPKIDTEPPLGDLLIIPQFAFIRYRLDFAVVAIDGERRKIIAVECDGAEFHTDKGKDNERDRYLSQFGIEVFRFTGAQIEADPTPLARLVSMAVLAWKDS